MRLESRQTDTVAQNENEVNSKTSKSARQDVVPKGDDDLEKASGDKKEEPSYREILDSLQEGFEDKPSDNDQSVQKDTDVVKTAQAGSEIYPAEGNENDAKKDLEQNAEAGEKSNPGSKENVELAQADTSKGNESSSSQSSSPAPTGAEAAASAPGSVFGSIAMVPVAAVGFKSYFSDNQK